MTGDGPNIIATLQQLRTLYQQVALLLSSTDGFMANHSWRPLPLNYVFAGISYTLSEPQKWIQQDFFRFYTNEASKHLLSFVSVILDDIESPKDLREPLLTAGWFDYGEGKEVGTHLKRFNYSLARWHLKMPGRTDDGRLIVVDHKVTPKVTPFFRVATLGLPLLSISDTKSLQDKIIGPLIMSLQTGP